MSPDLSEHAASSYTLNTSGCKQLHSEYKRREIDSILIDLCKGNLLLPLKSIILSCTHAGRSALQVLILPGNPGSAGYYEAYIAALHAALHGRADIHAVSHLGHASSKKARSHDNKVHVFGVVVCDLVCCAMHVQ